MAASMKQHKNIGGLHSENPRLAALSLSMLGFLGLAASMLLVPVAADAFPGSAGDGDASIYSNPQGAPSGQPLSQLTVNGVGSASTANAVPSNTGNVPPMGQGLQGQGIQGQGLQNMGAGQPGADGAVPRSPAGGDAAMGTGQETARLADQESSPEIYQNLKQALELKQQISPAPVSPDEFTSIVFTGWQYSILQEAERTFRTRDPNIVISDDGATAGEQPTGPREISLSGISFVSRSKWTIWLNGQRITGEALPKEILDIRVHPTFVELKWFDDFTDKIFPVRIRPHQRFNLDSRIFLPGTL